ncbi:GAF and ANTAR domain-containing protein [Arthrobacter sp. TmT3-37]
MHHSSENDAPDASELLSALGSDDGTAERLHQAVVDSVDVVEFLNQLTEIAVDVLGAPGRGVFCGVTLLRPKKVGTVASSSEQAQHLDEVQYRFDDGPCLTAARQEHEVYVPDVRTLRPGSRYRQAMEAQGVRSVFAVPIILPGDTYSALNLYSDRPEAFDARARRYAHRFAAEAAKSLGVATRLAALVDTGIDLRAAMESRATIDTAVGIIMGQNTCSQEQAVSILSTAASNRNMKLRDLAQQLITFTATGEPTTS